MMYIDDDSMLTGAPEACPDCGRDMLAVPYTVTRCSPPDYAMCHPKGS